MAGRVCVVCRIQPNGSSDAYRRWKLAVPSRARNVYLKLTCPCFQRRCTCSGMYQMFINGNAQPQGPSFLEMLCQGDWLFSQPPIMQPQKTRMYSAIQMMGYAGNTQSYGEPCSYSGGSSIAQHEIGPPQIDEPPPIT
uniref:Uncharacterized protein n=1 Tax=Oryza rufipogon TaxID=4529 RepID=A0A0E0NXH3_ORYRU